MTRRFLRLRALVAAVAVSLAVAGLSVEPPASPGRPAVSAPRVDPRSLLPRVENPLAAMSWFAETRMTADGRLPVTNYIAARAQARAQLRQARRAARLGQIAPGAFSRPWTALGPRDEGGRTRALVIDPRDPNVMYSGGVAGGLFKSTDAGATWRPVTDVFGNVAVSSIAMDPTNPDVVYVGTGELLASGHQQTTTGIGILKTTTAGQSWRLIGSTVGFGVVNDIVVSSNDPNAVYAAVREGVVRSSDGGDTWQTVLPGPERHGCTDLAIRTDRNPDVVFASCGLANPGGVHRSEDGGTTWEPVISDVEGEATGNTVIALAPSNQDIVYASVAQLIGGTNSAIALLRSDQGGADGTWEVRNTADDSPGQPRYLDSCRSGSGQGYYGNAIAVDPTDPERLWVGGVDGYRSDDGGRTLTIAAYWELRQMHAMGDGTPWAHADWHGIVYHPQYDGQDNQTVYFATDGGVFRTRNDRAPLPNPDCFPDEPPSDEALLNDVVYDALNDGFSTIQFYGGAVSDDGRYITGGTQDNGTYGLDRQQAGGPDDWILVQGGDGFETAISPNNDAFYMEYYSGAITRRRELTVTQNYPEEPLYQRIPAGQEAAGRFHSPFALDPNDPNVFWVGWAELWRSTDSATTFAKAGTFDIERGISAITIAPSDSNVVYVGTDTGKVYLSTNALAAPPGWADVSTGLPQGLVSSIAVHPTAPGTVYVTYANFGLQKVWKTTDFGATWTNVDGVLPDVPVNAVAVNPVNPEMVYVGTDAGIYESPNGGRSWLPANGELVSTIVMKLVFRRGTSELYAFTHGRGAYTVDVGSGA